MANYTPLTDGQNANAANFNAPLAELSDAIDDVRDGSLAQSSPQITSFTNSTHDHTDAVGGGRLPPSALDTTGANAGDVPVAQADSSVAWEAFRVVPAGAMMAWPVSTVPSGWLICDGRAVSRATYAALFAAIGTTFGAGDGSTTFNLPDMRGRTWAGLDNMGGSSANRVTNAQADAMGGSMGAETHILSMDEMPVHNHTPGSIGYNFVTYDTKAGSQAYQQTGGTGTIGQNSITSSQGGNQAHNNIQPTLFGNWIIAS